MLVSKQIEIDMSHKLTNYNGACNNVHGHRILVEIGIEGNIIQTKGTSEGMVVDFKIIKELLRENIHSVFDHALTVYEKDPLIHIFRMLKDNGMKVNIINYNPTSENFAKEWFKILNDKLKEEINLQLKYINVWETATAFATYTDNDFIKDKPNGQKTLYDVR